MGKVRFLSDYLYHHAASCPVSFHVPGHKGAAFFSRLGYDPQLAKLPDYDLTEIPGADNLFVMDGVLGELAARYQRLYGTERTFPLVNGSTAGVEAAIMAAVRPGQKILVSRNCHRSVFQGVRLAGAVPVYFQPAGEAPAFEDGQPAGLPAGVFAAQAEKLFAAHPDAAALVLTSPDYFGTLSPVRAIARAAHAHGAALIVDQAHGAHLRLMERAGLLEEEVSAEAGGADYIIESTHKTLASFTQSALLHCREADAPRVLAALELLESSSPSYLLMLSLDWNAEILEGQGPALLQAWLSGVRAFRSKAAAIAGLRVLPAARRDPTRLVVDFGARVLTGAVLARRLEDRGVWPEMAAGGFVVCETGIGNTDEDYEALARALEEIGAEAEAEDSARPAAANGAVPADSAAPGDGPAVTGGPSAAPAPGSGFPDLPVPAFAGIPAATEEIPLAEAAGRVCGAMLVPYPPGVPAACPGEILSGAIVDAVQAALARGETVLGVSAQGTVRVGAEGPREGL